MRNLLNKYAALALMATVIGCTQGTPGGPGAVSPPPETTTAHRPDFGNSEETFTLSVPSLSTHLKQGETKTASVGVSRGKNFDEDVTLKFDDVPKGVVISPLNPVIKHGESEASVSFQAAADAALGNFTIKINGHPTKGADATSTFKLTVDEK